MADVTYNTESFPSLIRTLKTVMEVGEPSSNNRPQFLLMGYKERHPDERTLWQMTHAIGLNLERVGQEVGHGGAPVEIWVCLRR